MAIEFEASASIGLAIGEKLDKLHSLLSKPDAKPLYIPVAVSQMGAGALFVARPPLGKLWNILTVTVTGDDDHTALSSVAVSLYSDCESSNLSLMQCMIPALTVPSFKSLSKGTVWAHAGGEIVANVTGSGATGHNIQVGLTVAEWKVSDVVSPLI